MLVVFLFFLLLFGDINEREGSGCGEKKLKGAILSRTFFISTPFDKNRKHFWGIKTWGG